MTRSISTVQNVFVSMCACTSMHLPYHTTSPCILMFVYIHIYMYKVSVTVLCCACGHSFKVHLKLYSLSTYRGPVSYHTSWWSRKWPIM